LFLPVFACSNKAKIGSFDIPVQPAFDRSKNRLEHRVAFFQNIDVPEAQHRPTLGDPELLAHPVAPAFGVMAAVHLNDKSAFPTRKVSKIGANIQLAYEFVAIQFSIPKIGP
jgi:hypothetical protein